MKLEVLLDLISDRQLAEYVAWLDEHPDSNEEDSLDFLMNILTKRQWEDINYFLETDDFNAIPYSNWYGACIHPDGRCFEATMQDCRMLGGKFQGQGTSCGGYQRPRVMGSESVWESWQDHWMSGEANENVVNEIAEAVVKNDPAGNLVIVDNYGWYLELSNEQREDLLTKPYLHEIIYEDIERMGESWGDEDSFNAFWEPADAQCYECGTKAHHTCAQCEHRWCNRHWSAPLWPYLNREEQPLCRRCAKDWIASPTHDGQTGPLGGAIFNAPEGQVFRDPSSSQVTHV